MARHTVVLIEPIYELANDEAQKRMDQHGYVKGLKTAAEKNGAEILDFRLLDYCTNPLNPSGLLVLRKASTQYNMFEEEREIPWQCPLTGNQLVDYGDLFFAQEVGIAYPVVREVPMLRPEHAIVASGIRFQKVSS